MQNRISPNTDIFHAVESESFQNDSFKRSFQTKPNKRISCWQQYIEKTNETEHGLLLTNLIINNIVQIYKTSASGVAIHLTVFGNIFLLMKYLTSCTSFVKWLNTSKWCYITSNKEKKIAITRELKASLKCSSAGLKE